MAIKTNISGTPSRELLKTEITVLSHGYYTNGRWPDGKITVFPWDSYTDDLLLRRVRDNASDVALYDLLPRLCTLNGVPLNSILVGDAQTILLVSRAARKSCKIMLSYTSQGKTKDTQIIIPDQLSKIAEKSADYPGYDTIILPDAKDEIALRPLTIGDMKSVYSRTDDEKIQLPNKIMSALIAIMTVGGSKPDNPEELQHYWDAITPTDQQYIYDQQDALYPHLSDTVELVDTDTNEKYSFKIDLDSKFFR